MSGKLYACCDDPSCPYCGGSGVTEGPEADAFMKALGGLPRCYDEPQDKCPTCGSGSYEASPFGAAMWVECKGCCGRWIEPIE